MFNTCLRYRQTLDSVSCERSKGHRGHISAGNRQAHNSDKCHITGSLRLWDNTRVSANKLWLPSHVPWPPRLSITHCLSLFLHVTSVNDFVFPSGPRCSCVALSVAQVTCRTTPGPVQEVIKQSTNSGTLTHSHWSTPLCCLAPALLGSRQQ